MTTTAPTTAPAEATATCTLDIGGMTCASCVHRVGSARCCRSRDPARLVASVCRAIATDARRGILAHARLGQLRDLARA